MWYLAQEKQKLEPGFTRLTYTHNLKSCHTRIHQTFYRYLQVSSPL